MVHIDILLMILVALLTPIIITSVIEKWFEQRPRKRTKGGKQ